MTADQIAASLRAEAARLRALAATYKQLAWILAPADATPEPVVSRRRRRAPTPAPITQPRAPQTVSLHVQTVGTPESELEGREVAYTTQEPAA